MVDKIKVIAVLTSGGDAPGMNPAIRAVVRCAKYYGIDVKGVRDGYQGLINGDFIDMDARDVADILQRGGTVLHTARCMEFKTLEGQQRAAEKIRKAGIDAIVVVGGDGSFNGAMRLCEQGIPTVAMPGTIDNDISCSEYTIGYDTCLNTVIEAVDKIRDTTASHHRCSVIEVMGRAAGYIAVNAAIACGADVVLVPEYEWNYDEDVIKPILASTQRGKKHSIVIVAEGVGGSVELAKRIEKDTGIESRATVLGHVQRGGSPTVRDRVVASRMGARCVDLLREGKSNRIVCRLDGRITDVGIAEGLAMKKEFPKEYFELAKKLSY